MFLQVFVCPQGGSTWAGTPRDQVHPLGPDTPPGTRYIPQTRYTPGPGTPPPRPGTPRETADAADGTHPTGVHSCLMDSSTLAFTRA